MSDILLGRTGSGEELRLPLKSMLRHAVALGSSGSGKTVLCKVLVEEFIQRGLPVVAVDPQGDLCSLAQLGDEAESSSHGTPPEIRQAFSERAEVVVWTPASALGVPLSVNPLAGSRPSATETAPSAEESSEDDDLRESAFAAEALTDLLGYGLRSKEGRYVTALFGLVLSHAAESDTPIDGVGALLRRLGAMPRELADRAAGIVDEKLLEDLTRRLRTLTVGPQARLFTGGVPLDVDRLLGRGPEGAAPGKTRLSVIYLNTLASERERQFFLGQLAQALYRWMLAHPSAEPQALFYIDEMAPYLPPVREPVCKDALKLLFRQARKYGLCCLAASQNPGDIDYKALAQIGTWGLGRMMTRQDVKKIEGLLRSLAPDDAERIAETMPALEPGRFVLVAPDVSKSPLDLHVRWLVTRHRTLNEAEIAAATDPEVRRRLESALGLDEESGSEAAATDQGEDLAGPASGRVEVKMLAVTAEGEGSVNPCEIVVTRGTGKITALGGQSRVTKESIKAAWEAASQLQAQLDLPRSFARRYDVTVLDTRLAVKKDGPSAGLAYLTGIIAALRQTQPRPDVAMTGEITILGKVLSVGGVAEKVRAAYNTGYSTVVVPAENRAEMDALPEELRRGIEVVAVSTVHEALPVIFAEARRARLEPPSVPLPRLERPGQPAIEPPLEAPELGRTSDEQAPERPARVEDRVRELLAKEASALGAEEIAGRLGEGPSGVTAALGRLNKDGGVKKARSGRRMLYYHADHALLPEFELFGPVEAVKLRIFEPEARKRVEADLASTLLVFAREEVVGLRLAYLPLYKVRFTTKIKEGWLFKREVERRDNLYFNALTGELLTYVKGSGFSFAAGSPQSPIDVVDLDDLGCLETRLPGELELDEKEMRSLLGSKGAEATAARKFQLEILETSLVFLPVWRALLRDKQNRSERDLNLDGWEGRPIVIGRPASPRAARR
jgi:DNA helicase HerA-like ATPase/DNA-binding transcriptional ArsR family regulator